MTTNPTLVDLTRDERLLPRTTSRIPVGDTGLTVRRIAAAEMTAQQIATTIEVFRRAFNGGPSWFAATEDPTDHLRWKTTDRPGGGAFRLVEQGDRIVGISVEGVQTYLLRGERVVARQGFDAANELEFQGRGVQSTLRHMRDTGTLPQFGAFAIGAGAHPTSSLRRGVKSKSVALANPIDSLVRPLSIRSLLRRRAGKQMGPSRTREAMESADPRLARRRPVFARLRVASSLAGSLALKRPAERTGSWTIRTIERFDERADELWADASPEFDLIQVRDQRYLNWRFCDRRGGMFDVRVAEEHGQLLGYAVIRVGAPAAVLADVLVMPGRDDVLLALIDDASLVAKRAGASYLRAWCARHHPYRRVFESSGFVQHDAAVTIGLRPIVTRDAVMAVARDPEARVHFSVADTDHV